MRNWTPWWKGCKTKSPILEISQYQTEFKAPDCDTTNMFGKKDYGK